MGAITDERTRRYVQGLLGEASDERLVRTEARLRGPSSKADAASLQQLARDRARLIEGHRRPRSFA